MILAVFGGSVDLACLPIVPCNPPRPVRKLNPNPKIILRPDSQIPCVPAFQGLEVCAVGRNLGGHLHSDGLGFRVWVSGYSLAVPGFGFSL